MNNIEESRICAEKSVKLAAGYAISERDISDIDFFYISQNELNAENGPLHSDRPFEGNGQIAATENSVLGLFQGELSSYQVKLNLPVTDALFNGITICYRVSGWKSIRYVALGHSEESGFRHLKITNLKQDRVTTTSIGYADIAFGLQNKWDKPHCFCVTDIRVYVSGEPGENAQIEVFWCSRWQENSEAMATKLAAHKIENNHELFSSLKQYFTRCNVSLEQHAKRYLETGEIPVSGDVYLDWSYEAAKPRRLGETGTYSYTWHAMHPVISLMVYGVDNESSAAIFAARDIITCWLNDSFFNADEDVKYTWYDHGTAERLIAFIFMHYIGTNLNFDYRFMKRLRYAIIKHTQLLESEVFYSYLQRTRYHNHAWFQDMALIAAAVAFKSWPAASRWLDVGIERLEDQLDKLIIRDSGFAVFIENSIGYHLGVQRLADFAGELVKLSGRDSTIPQIALELDNWSTFFRYPDYTLPANGDTFKKPLAEKFYRGKPYLEQGLTVLPKAGYAVLKQNVNGKPLMLTMLGSSLCKTHKHEDNLAITLFYDGVEWLTDPSFHSHNYTDELPAYLRSAEAHNTVYIPERSYSLESGNCQLCGEQAVEHWLLKGKHTSYENVIVERELKIGKTPFLLEATDTLNLINEMPALEERYLVFHLGESVTASLEQGKATLSSEHSDYKLILLFGQYNATLVSGLEEYRKSVIGLGFEQYINSNSLLIPITDNTISWQVNFLAPFLKIRT